ncbi:hypothetical protein D3C75_989580 [compost metagenome]
MLAYDHTFINVSPRLQEEDTAVFNTHHAVECRCSGFAGYQHTLVTSANLAADQRSIAVERMVHYAVSAGQCQEVCIVADQAACRDQEFQTYLASTVVDHVNHFGFACSKTFHNGTHALFRNINQQALKRLHLGPVDFLHDNFRLGNLHLIAFTAHILN